MKHLKTYEEKSLLNERYEYVNEDFTMNDMEYVLDLWNDGFRDPEEIGQEVDMSAETVTQIIYSLKKSGQIDEDDD